MYDCIYAPNDLRAFLFLGRELATGSVVFMSTHWILLVRKHDIDHDPESEGIASDQGCPSQALQPSEAGESAPATHSG